MEETTQVQANAETENKTQKGKNQKKKNDFAANLYEWLELFVIAFTAVMLTITLFMRHSPVQGSSMIDTLHNGDMLIVVSDLFYKPKQNDIIVFHSQATGYAEPYVKRVIAVGGQTVDIDFETWTVTVDGVELDEDYVHYIEDEPMHGSFMDFPVTVPEGYMFVMGDNRNGSTDSRSGRIGFVDERFVIGHVIFRLFPFEVMGTVD